MHENTTVKRTGSLKASMENNTEVKRTTTATAEQSENHKHGMKPHSKLEDHQERA